MRLRPTRLNKKVRILSWSIGAVVFVTAPFNLAAADMSNATRDVYDHIRNICIEDSPNFDAEVPLIEPQSEGPPISLGCKLRDCGPLANDLENMAPRPINFRVRLDGGDAAESVLIEFSNLPSGSARDIKIKKGSGSIGVNQGNVRVPRGEDVIVEIPSIIMQDGRLPNPPPKINATLFLSRSFLLRTRTEGRANLKESPSWTANLTIEQLKGPVVVNEFKALYVLRWCTAPKPLKQPDLQPIAPIIAPVLPQADQIILTGIHGDLKRLALINGIQQSSGCIKDTPHWGTGTISLENMVGTSPDCPSNEIVIFSPDRAMKIAKPDPNWTPRSDMVKIPLPESRAKVPVTFWILHKPEEQTIVEFKNAIKDELNRANELFGPDNLCGVEFIAGEESYRDKIKDAQYLSLSDVHCPEEGSFLKYQQLVDKKWRDSRSVNVYYVSDFANHRGSHCPGGEIFVGPDRDQETLAHELGHALGLNDALDELRDAHVNTLDAARRLLTADNLMISGGSNRAVLTQGQCYRCSVNETSAVITLAPPESNPTTRDCTGRLGPKQNCVDVFLNVKPSQ